MVCKGKRIFEVLHDASIHLFAGQIEDQEALEEAIKMGLVEIYYEGAMGFMGLGKLRLVEC